MSSTEGYNTIVIGGGQAGLRVRLAGRDVGEDAKYITSQIFNHKYY